MSAPRNDTETWWLVASIQQHSLCSVEICIAATNRVSPMVYRLLPASQARVGRRPLPTNWNTSVSSMIFCTKKGAVVKNTRREKVRNLSCSVESFYVNSGCIFYFQFPVENPCGKDCGECGKVWVFNRYFGSLKIRCPMWKTLHTMMHNRASLRQPIMLRYRLQEVLSSRKSTKLLKPAVILTVKSFSPFLLQKYFCEMWQIQFPGIIFPVREILSLFTFARRLPCREK